MTNDALTKILQDVLGYDTEITDTMGVFENPDFSDAIIGVTEDTNKLVYDYHKMVTYLMAKDGCSESDAIEFLEYNTLAVLPYMGETAPVIVNRTIEPLIDVNADVRKGCFYTEDEIDRLLQDARDAAYDDGYTAGVTSMLNPGSSSSAAKVGVD